MAMMMRRSLEMGSLSFNQQTNSGIMDDLHHPLDSNFLPYSDNISSSESDLMEDGSSSGSSSPISPKGEKGPLGDMSSLLQQLPFKRGLSKHFNGKSQSFGSLSNVTCLEDLAKPENPYNKKLKYCKSYMGLSEAAAAAQRSPSQPTLNKRASSKLIYKKSSSRGSCSSLGGKRNGSFVGNNSMRPPTHPPPHRSNSTACFSNHTPLFA